MKLSEFKHKSTNELKDELLSLRRELFNLKMQRSTNQVIKPHLFKKIRRNIARIKTIEAGKSE